MNRNCIIFLISYWSFFRISFKLNDSVKPSSPVCVYERLVQSGNPPLTSEFPRKYYFIRNTTIWLVTRRGSHSSLFSYRELTLVCKCTHLHRALCCDDAVYGGISEGVKAAISAAHEVWLQEVATVAIVLEFALVQLHGKVWSLEVQRYHLASRVPEHLSSRKIRIRIKKKHIPYWG